MKVKRLYQLLTFVICTLIFLLCKKEVQSQESFVNSHQNQLFNTTKNQWELAIFAGGCFWCMEQPFEQVKGVKNAVSGYTGGKEVSPSYNAVAGGRTTHIESVVIEYDPKIITYKQLLSVFWQNINPTQADGQFYDKGSQYQTVIFYLNQQQKKEAELSKITLEKSKKFKNPIVTNIVPASKFWIAEEYHQDYYKKNPTHYNFYKKGSGREAFLKKHWKK